LAPAAPPPRLGYVEGHDERDHEHNRKEAIKQAAEDALDNKKKVGKLSNAYDPRNYRQAKREQKEIDYGISMDLFNTQRRLNPLMQVKSQTMAVATDKIKLTKIAKKVKKQLTAREAADAALAARLAALEGRSLEMTATPAESRNFAFDPRMLDASPGQSPRDADDQ